MDNIVDVNEAVAKSEETKKAIALHIALTGANPSKEQLKAAGLDKSPELAKDPEAPGSHFVLTNNVADLPPGASARRVSDGIFEVFHTSDADAQAAKKAQEAQESEIKPKVEEIAVLKPVNSEEKPFPVIPAQPGSKPLK